MLAKVDNKLLDNIISESIELIQFIDLIVFRLKRKKTEKPILDFVVSNRGYVTFQQLTLSSNFWNDKSTNSELFYFKMRYNPAVINFMKYIAFIAEFLN